MMATMPICSSRPSIDAAPPRPPMKPLPNSMPSRPAPRKPANMPPRKPGRLKKPPAGDVCGARCPNVLPDWPGWVMLRSIGRALGDVAVDGGAEKVCEPRLPKLPPRPARASASPTANASTATSAQNASNGRNLKRDIDSSQETIRFDLTYWWFMTAFKEVPHGVADGLQAAAGIALGRKRVDAGVDPPPAVSFCRRKRKKVRTDKGGGRPPPRRDSA